MSIELKVPSAGESITEVTIVEWLKGEGSTVSVDETVALIETDKANVELPAPAAGVITKVLKPAGEVVNVGDVIGYMEAGDAAAAPKAEAKKEAKGKAKAKAPEPEPAPEKGDGVAAPPPLLTQLPGRAQEEPPAPAPKAAAPEAPAPKRAGAIDVAQHLPPAEAVRASPSVRRSLMEHGIDPKSVPATGPGGFITHGDLERREQQMPVAGSRAEERVKMTPLRKRIAARLVESQQTAALLTTFNEVDMGAVMALRAQFQDQFVKKHGIKLGFMSFFVKAVVEALKALPAVNASIEGDEVVYHDYYDIGVAVGGGRGLVVPVIRNAERLSFSQVEKVIADFGTRAKDNRLKVEELQGGTFTISNGGIYGSLMSTPIINPPQSGILGMHAIQERPVVKDGQIVVAKMMYVALTYDHRLVDGREAVTFLVRIKELLENPARLLLEV
ncbi:MAG: 2-oxoglutarate dehydrogenase complex dihydrolipoyllysine-residue succinyltransferase [Deltaproteobacteria bacterium]|nr:2-oxoglutarate dehydrogenase complex dihydrolipoyllysine-residue succinyltransferase [Deltaproteobacteria bacterium]